MNNDLKVILSEIQSVKAEVGSLRTEVGSLKTEVGSLKTEMGSLKTEMGSLKTEMGSLRRDMESMEVTLRQEIRDGDNAIRLILENEIRPQIRMVAEGHLDLNRKLDEIKSEMKKNELLPARVSLLEKDMRMVKQKLAIPV